LSRRGLQAAVALAVLLIGGWLAVRWWVSPERRVNRNIKKIQELVSKTPGESDLVALGKARRLSEMFADNFEFRAAGFDFYTRDRQRLAAGAHQYRSFSQAIAMRVRQKELTVDKEHRRASTYLTADFVTKARDITGREAYRFRIDWVEQEGDWKIDYVELLEILEEPTRAWI
jgi:hypothetical protein